MTTRLRAARSREANRARIPRRRERRRRRAQKGYVKHARREWRFLTRFDCSSIETKGQLRSMVGTRSGISEERAKRDVDAWTEGERF